MPEGRRDKTYMSVLKILHAADLHLDSPFDGLPEAKAAQRRAEQRELLGAISDLARDNQVDLVLLAGDLLDSDSAYGETAQELVRSLGGIPAEVIISPGNHDYYSNRSPYSRLHFPSNVHIFTKNEVECIEMPEIGARIYGAAFTDKYSAGLLRGFTVEKKPNTADIMCIHGELAKASQYDPITEDEIAASKLDYIALGHVHQGSGLKKAGDTYYSWPGCPEGRGFDELGEKFLSLVALADGQCRLVPVSVARRKYEILPVALGEEDALKAIEAVLPEETKDDVYRIILHGETDTAPDIAMLKTELEDRFFSLQLRDETVLRRDVWEKAGEDSLRGLFLQKLRAMLDATADENEKEKIVMAARWGLAALDRREEVVRHEDK